MLFRSQDTSAYAMDTQRKEGGVKTAFWNGMPIKNDLMTLCKQLGKLGIWVRCLLYTSHKKSVFYRKTIKCRSPTSSGTCKVITSFISNLLSNS